MRYRARLNKRSCATMDVCVTLKDVQEETLGYPIDDYITKVI